MADQRDDSFNGSRRSTSLWARLRHQPLRRVIVATGLSLLVLLVGVTRLVVATDHSNDDPQGLPTSPTKLTSSTASAIAGLPIPKQARSEGLLDRGDVEYVVPDSVNQTKGWYLERLSEGQAWHDWRWFTAGEPSAGTYTGGVLWQWVRNGSTLSILIYPSQVDRPFAAVNIGIVHQPPFCNPQNP